MRDRSRDAPAIVAYRIAKSNGDTAVVGKLVLDAGVRVFYRKYKWPELIKWDALSFDARLLPVLLDAEVVYVDQHINELLYRVPLRLFETDAVLAQHNPQEGPQLYLPKDRWIAAPPHYTAGYTSREQLITGSPPTSWIPLKDPRAPKDEPPNPQRALL